MSDHEFDGYDFSEFSDADFVTADDLAHSKLSETTHALSTIQPPLDTVAHVVTPLSSGPEGSAISLRNEQSTNHRCHHVDSTPVSTRAASTPDPQSCPSARSSTGFIRNRSFQLQSPFQRFRSWRRTFTVTDLVSPAWCEVQFDYGLRQQRHKPLEKRPNSFTAASGKQISVQNDTAALNNKAQKKGKSVHKQLEKEIHPDVYVVNTTSEEERWGLRVHNLIAGLHELLLTGLTRELPVFGIQHGEIVIGVIDEVQTVQLGPKEPTRWPSGRIPSPDSEGQGDVPPPAQRQLTEIDDSSTTATAAETDISPAGEEPVPPTSDKDVVEDAMASLRAVDHYRSSFQPVRDVFVLKLSDYKTRRSYSLPSDDDSMPAKLQLMLYHRLLSSLLDHERLDFSALWQRLNLSPERSFSAKFVRDIHQGSFLGDEYSSQGTAEVNLARMVELWRTTVNEARNLGLSCVAPHLQITYRSVNYKRRNNRASKRTRLTAQEQEDLDLARAIQESLNDARSSGIIPPEPAVTVSIEEPEGMVTPRIGSPAPDALSKSSLNQSGPPCVTQQDDEGDSTDQEAETQSDLIGTRGFEMDDALLDRYLSDVLQWWHGKREPRGVEIAQASRCASCEYRDGCEWREHKALELAARAKKPPIGVGTIDF